MTCARLSRREDEFYQNTLALLCSCEKLRRVDHVSGSLRSSTAVFEEALPSRNHASLGIGRT